MAFSWGNYNSALEGSGDVACGETESLPCAVTPAGVSAPDPSSALNDEATVLNRVPADAHTPAASSLSALSTEREPRRGTVSRSATRTERAFAPGFMGLGVSRSVLSASVRAPNPPTEPHGVTGALNLVAPFHAVKGKP